MSQKIFVYRDGPDENHLSTTALPCSSLERAKYTADSMAGGWADSASEWVRRDSKTIMRTLEDAWVTFTDPTGLAPSKTNDHRVQFIEEDILDFRVDWGGERDFEKWKAKNS